MLNVLLIEDNERDIHLITGMISEVNGEKFKLESVKKPSEALKRLDEGNYDLILLDLELSGKVSMKTFDNVHSHSPDIPIVILSCLDNNDIAIKSVRGGAQDYLKKDGLYSELLLKSMEYAVERSEKEKQLRMSLAEKEAMLREIHHRVKNNLQIISSLLNMQSRYVKDEQFIRMLMESRDRVNTMALIHSQLYESDNLAEVNLKRFFESLIRDLAAVYPSNSVRISASITTAGRPVPITIAVPLGLIVNELLTNAYKYAFVGRNKGEVKIMFKSSKKGSCSLLVQDDGVGFLEDFKIENSKTLGLKIVRILAEEQLCGKFELIKDKGTTFKVNFKC